jgi:hypothetical protein
MRRAACHCLGQRRQVRGAYEGAAYRAEKSAARSTVGRVPFLTGCGSSLNSEFARARARKWRRRPPIGGEHTSWRQALLTKRRPRQSREATTRKIGPLGVLELSVFKVPEHSRVAQIAEPASADRQSSSRGQKLTNMLAAIPAIAQISMLINEHNTDLWRS